MFHRCLPCARLRTRRAYLLCKRGADFLVSFSVLFVLFPALLLLVGLLYAETGKCPVRLRPFLGANGRVILCPCFIPTCLEGARPVSAFVCRHGLWRVLWLFSVAAGDMSLVGPCPVSARDAAAVRRRLGCKSAALRPGLTGLWKTQKVGALAFSEAHTDRFYYFGCSLWLDAKILLAALRRRLSYSR